jgi:hypothetical protein
MKITLRKRQGKKGPYYMICIGRKRKRITALQFNQLKEASGTERSAIVLQKILEGVDPS